MKWIVVAGDPVDGFGYHGPFVTWEEAHEYAQRMPASWWIVALEQPEKP